MAEQLVLEQDLLGDLAAGSPTSTAPRGDAQLSNWARAIGGQPRSRPMRPIIPP